METIYNIFLLFDKDVCNEVGYAQLSIDYGRRNGDTFFDTPAAVRRIT